MSCRLPPAGRCWPEWRYPLISCSQKLLTCPASSRAPPPELSTTWKQYYYTSDPLLTLGTMWPSSTNPRCTKYNHLQCIVVKLIGTCCAVQTTIIQCFWWSKFTLTTVLMYSYMSNILSLQLVCWLMHSVASHCTPLGHIKWLIHGISDSMLTALLEH